MSEDKTECSSPTIESAKRSVKSARECILVDPAVLAVEAIVHDISGRRGLRHEWEAIENRIRENDIKATWIEIIRQVIRESR
jgi:hypothetical protein